MTKADQKKDDTGIHVIFSRETELFNQKEEWARYECILNKHFKQVQTNVNRRKAKNLIHKKLYCYSMSKLTFFRKVQI